jgi:hypothetical protein
VQAIRNTLLTFRHPRVLRRSWAPVCAVRWMGMVEDQRSGDLVARYLAIVMLGTPTRGTSLTVIWNKRYNIWKASRFQRASGPVVFTA